MVIEQIKAQLDRLVPVLPGAGPVAARARIWRASWR